jgi:hypothetical protein
VGAVTVAAATAARVEASLVAAWTAGAAAARRVAAAWGAVEGA